MRGDGWLSERDLLYNAVVRWGGELLLGGLACLAGCGAMSTVEAYSVRDEADADTDQGDTWSPFDGRDESDVPRPDEPPAQAIGEDDPLLERNCIDAWVDGVFTMSEPRQVVELNSYGLEADPRVTDDGLTIYFTSSRIGWDDDSDIFVAHRPSRSVPFGKPTYLEGINSEDHESGFSVWPNGMGAYFATDRGTDKKQLWKATRRAPFDEFVVEGPISGVNTDADDFDPMSSEDGLRLYWTAVTDDSTNDEGKAHMRMATRTATDKPFELSRELVLDTSAYEDSPALSRDERVIVFGTSHGGDHDLWYAVRASPEDDFSAPLPVPGVNSTARDGEAFLSADGCDLYFASDRTGGLGSWDLYSSRILETP